MLIQSRLSGLGAQWGQLSKLGKIVIVSVAVFFVLVALWGTGTVDVDYVRNQFTSTPETHGYEPIPQDKTETPIIDGIPNDQNDRIPDKLIEEAGNNQSTKIQNEIGNGNENIPKEPNPTASIKAKPTKIATEKSPESDAASLVGVKPGKTEPENFYKQNSTLTVKPANTGSAKPHPGPIAGGIPLRVMFIGASMTLGDPRQSAYRMQLREWLVSLGNPVNCVGTSRFGQFKDNDVQAFAATPIHILHEKARQAVLAMQPNLIIVNAGSSDCFQERNWGSAHGFDYTRELVDFLFEASPRATVILSTLVTSTSPTFERCIKSMNAQIRQVAADVKREGKHLILSEQHFDQGLPGRVTAGFIKPDQMHPTFQGWEMMGEIYKQDILAADANKWIVAPVKNGIMDDGDVERDLEEAKEKLGGGKTTVSRIA